MAEDTTPHEEALRRLGPLVSDLRHMRFELPDGHRISSIVLRELAAVESFTPRRDSSGDTKVKQASSLDEREDLRIAVVQVDDEEVEQPWMEMDALPARTERVLTRFYERLNGVDSDEVETVLKSGKPWTAPAGSKVPEGRPLTEFTLPKGHRYKSFVVVELSARDEIEGMSKIEVSAEGMSVTMALGLQMHCRMRQAVVALDGAVIDRASDLLDYVPLRTQLLLQAGYMHVNEVDQSEVQNSLKAGVDWSPNGKRTASAGDDSGGSTGAATPKSGSSTSGRARRATSAGSRQTATST